MVNILLVNKTPPIFHCGIAAWAIFGIARIPPVKLSMDFNARLELRCWRRRRRRRRSGLRRRCDRVTSVHNLYHIVGPTSSFLARRLRYTWRKELTTSVTRSLKTGSQSQPQSRRGWY